MSVMSEKLLFPLYEDQPWQAPNGALEGQFCKHHIATKENPDGTDCAAHLAEAMVFRCMYESPTRAEHGPLLDDFGVCEDFKPRSFGPDSDFRANA